MRNGNIGGYVELSHTITTRSSVDPSLIAGLQTNLTSNRQLQFKTISSIVQYNRLTYHTSATQLMSLDLTLTVQRMGKLTPTLVFPLYLCKYQEFCDAA